MPQSAVIPPTRPRHLRLLVVDDCAADIELIANAFGSRQAPVEVVAAPSAVVALEILMNRRGGTPQPRPDLVVLDVRMPEVDGLSLLLAIRSAEATRRLPVVVLTSFPTADDAAYVAGFDVLAYLRKPGDWNGYLQLVERLQRFADRRSVEQVPEPPIRPDEGISRQPQ